MATSLLAIGGYMMMPFGSVYAVNNLKVSQQQLPIIFMVAGMSTLITMPMIGRLSDRISKFNLFTIASVWMVIMVLIYTRLPVIPLWAIIIFNVSMMAGIMSRMVPATTMTSAIPDPQDRGAFMSVNASLQQIAGGLASFIAGLIVVQPTNFSPLEHYDTLGIVTSSITLLCIGMMYRVKLLLDTAK